MDWQEAISGAQCPYAVNVCGKLAADRRACLNCKKL